MQLNDFTIIIGLIFGILLFYKLPKLKKNEIGGIKEKILISVIIPARNEQDHLPQILSDLSNQTYDIHEIICVDDNSEDNTLKIIGDFDVKCVQLKSLPYGWKGKTWASQNGAEASTGDVLLFIDADVRLRTDAVEVLANRYIDKKTPISIKQYHTVKKQHEFFSLIFNMIEICSTLMSFIGNSRKLGFYGPLLLIPKKLFNEHGGYNVVKNNVAEDLSLGQFYNKNGIEMDLLLGGDFISFCMYPKSIFQVIEGWAKNFSSASLSLKTWLLIAIIMWIAFLVALPLEMIRSIVAESDLQIVIYSSIYLINVLLIYRVVKEMGSYPFYVCVLYPLYLMMFIIVYIYSMISTFILKSTTWKGRKL
jgi:4,4'-diaponeurosporenoate glycosyltransferase